MKILDVQSREVHVLFEMSASDLHSLKIMLDKAEISFDGANPEESEAHKYFTEVFYPTLDGIVKKLYGERKDGN